MKINFNSNLNKNLIEAFCKAKYTNKTSNVKYTNNVKINTSTKKFIPTKDFLKIHINAVDTKNMFNTKQIFSMSKEDIFKYVRKNSGENFKQVSDAFGTNEIVFEGLTTDIDGRGRLLVKVLIAVKK